MPTAQVHILQKYCEWHEIGVKEPVPAVIAHQNRSCQVLFAHYIGQEFHRKSMNLGNRVCMHTADVYLLACKTDLCSGTKKSQNRIPQLAKLDEKGTLQLMRDCFI